MWIQISYKCILPTLRQTLKKIKKKYNWCDHTEDKWVSYKRFNWKLRWNKKRKEDITVLNMYTANNKHQVHKAEIVRTDRNKIDKSTVIFGYFNKFFHNWYTKQSENQ